MAMLTFEVPHKLDKDEALKRVQALTQKWQQRGVTSSWNGDSATLKGKVMGVTLDATVKVHGDKVGGEATDPGMLLRGQAKKYLTSTFNKFLDPTKSLADLAKENP